MSRLHFILREKEAILVERTEEPGALTLLFSDKKSGVARFGHACFPIREGLCRLCADALPAGPLTPHFIFEGTVYRGTPVYKAGQTLYPCPPSGEELARIHERLLTAEQRLTQLEATCERLCRAICGTPLFGTVQTEADADPTQDKMTKKGCPTGQ